MAQGELNLGKFAEMNVFVNSSAARIRPIPAAPVGFCVGS
jgi:hypothetical protein